MPGSIRNLSHFVFRIITVICVIMYAFVSVGNMNLRGKCSCASLLRMEFVLPVHSSYARTVPVAVTRTFQGLELS